jgi:DNA polymerase elongation subunit (family B)
MTAIACNQAAVAAMLVLAPGIDLMARDFKGRSAIDFALAYRDYETYDLLISTLKQVCCMWFGGRKALVPHDVHPNFRAERGHHYV